MESDQQRNKIDAIYDLREAVETKAHAEHELARTGTEAARDNLLSAQLDVEAKTQDAIDVCHECGGSHAGNDHGPLITDRHDNVISVDFRRDGTAN